MRLPGASVEGMRVTALLLLIACEKSGHVEATPGSSITSTAAPRIIKPEVVTGTPPSDAAVDAAAASADAAVVARRDSDRPTDAEVRRLADLLATEALADPTRDLSRRPGQDLGSMIDDVRTSNRTVGVGGGTSSDAHINVGTGPKIDPTGGSSDPAAPATRVAVSSNQSFDNTSLTPDLVLRKIQAVYLAGIKRCYKQYLKKDPTARGKIALALTVNETGRAVSTSASGFVKEVDDCLAGMMPSWRFPIPKDDDGDAVAATFSIVLTMVPD